MGSGFESVDGTEGAFIAGAISLSITGPRSPIESRSAGRDLGRLFGRAFRLTIARNEVNRKGISHWSAPVCSSISGCPPSARSPEQSHGPSNDS